MSYFVDVNFSKRNFKKNFILVALSINNIGRVAAILVWFIIKFFIPQQHMKPKCINIFKIISNRIKPLAKFGQNKYFLSVIYNNFSN